MRLLSAVLASALSLNAPAATAQHVEPVQPGGVVTLVATHDTAPGDTVPYSLDLAPGVRAFGSPGGVAVADASGAARVPLTLGVPADAPAGPMTLGTLTFDAAPAARSTTFEVVVAARRDLKLLVAEDTVTVAPAGLVDLAFRIRNRGNVADTAVIAVGAPADWEWHASPQRVALEPGASVHGTLQLLPPERAAPGGEHRIRVRIEAAGIRRSAVVTAAVVEREPTIEGLAQVPGSIFVGSSSGDAGAGVALQADGRLGGGARLSLVLRHSPLVPPTAFRSELAGPRVRLQLETDRWTAAAGDVFLPGDIFTGPVQHGRGGQLALRQGSITGNVLIARPWSHAASAQQGHLARVRTEVATPGGRFGVHVSSVERRSDLLPDFGSTGGGLTYDLRRGAHRLEAAAGLIRVSDGAAQRSGFAGSARYRGQWKTASLTTYLSTVPATTRRATSYGREASASAVVGVLPGVGLTGWGFTRSAPLVNGAPHPVSHGGAAGLRIGLPGESRLDLTAGLRQNDLVGDTLSATRTRFARTRLDVPVGQAWSLEADADLGKVRGSQSRSYRNYRLGLHWHAAGQWAWVGVTRHDGGQIVDTRLDLAGSIRFRSIRLHGGFNVPVRSGLQHRLSLWSGLEMPLTPDYDLLAGIDYTGARSEPARLSLGVRRRIGLPLPLPRTPVLEGIVFEDLDGDRLRDADEPVLAGVEVRLGAIRTTTDEDGRFQFYERSGGALRVHASSLPFGAMVPAGVYLPTSGSVDIPVIRTATLELHIFLDRDGDAVFDDAETPAARAAVALVDSREQSRHARTTDDGRVRFGGVEPGPYSLRVRRPDGSTFETPLRLDPGEHLERVIAVPLRGREIRLQSARMETAEPARPVRPAEPGEPTEPAPSRDPAEARTARFETVLFDFDDASLPPAARTTIDDLATKLAADPAAVLTLTGHTDAVGTADYNLTLARKRAEAVAAALIGAGVEAGRIRLRAAGERQPLASNATAEGRQQNRRVELRLETPR